MINVQYPLLSVIVPVYGTEKYLRKCIDSLLAETYPNIEISSEIRPRSAICNGL